MLRLAMAIGVAYALMGVALAISPDWFLSAVDWESRQGLYVAAGIRVAVGTVVLLAASAWRFPRVFRAVGAIALTAGLLIPFIPIGFWSEWIRWWMVDNLTLFRTIIAIAATLGGAFIAYASLPKGAAAP